MCSWRGLILRVSRASSGCIFHAVPPDIEKRVLRTFKTNFVGYGAHGFEGLGPQPRALNPQGVKFSA